LFIATISHFDGVSSCKTTATIVATIIIVEGVHLSSEICSTLYLCCILCLLCSKRSSWWIHRIVNIISRVCQIIEQLSSKVLQDLFSKIALDLHLKRSNQVSQLVLAPFLNILLLLQHLDRLPINCVNEPGHELTLVVNLLQLLDELFRLILECVDVLDVFELLENLGE